jgi:lysophospholipase L1-like esterase
MTWLDRGGWLAPALSLAVALAVGCGGEADPPSYGVGGSGPSGGSGGAGGASAGAAMSAGNGGSANGGSGTSGGGAGGSVAGMSGLGGAGISGASGLAGMSGSAGGSGTAGTAGTAGSSAGGAAGVAGTSGAAGSAGAGAGGVAAGGAGAGTSGAGGAAGASAGMAGSAGSAGSAGAAGFQPCPPTGACIILPFGDSITDGFGTPGGYRMDLFSLARDDMHEITYVGSLENGPPNVDGVTFPRRHEGHSGWRINQLLDLIPSPGFNTIPHVVLLMIGTNDVINNDALAQAPARLGNLLDEIIDAAPDALIVVAKITPMSTSDAQIRAYNDAIPGIVAARVDMGKHLIVVDQYTGFQQNELADGIHPNPAGYTRMAGVWYAAIEPYLR